MIKSLGHGIGATEFVSGAAILSDGNVGLILNVEELGYASSSNTPGTMHRRTRRAGAGAAPVPAGPQADAAGVNV